MFDFSDPESRSGTKASLWWPEAPSAVTTQTHQTTRVVRHQWHTSSMGGAVESADPLTCLGPIQPRVMRQVDDPHAPAAKLGDDRIRAECRTNERIARGSRTLPTRLSRWLLGRLPLLGEALGFGDLFRRHFLGNGVTRTRIGDMVLIGGLS